MDLILFEVMMWGRPSQSWPVLKLSQPWKTSKESTSRRVRSEEALPCCQLYPIVSNEKRQSDTTCFFPTWQKFAGGRPRVSGGLHFDRSAQVRQRWFNKSSRFQLSNMRRNKTDPTIFESQLYLESFWKNVQRSDDYATYFHGLYSRIQKEVPFWAGKLWLLWLCRRSLTWERGTTAKHHDSKNRSGVGDADAAAAILEAAARPIPPKKSRLQTFSSVICVLCSSQHKQDSLENVFWWEYRKCLERCDDAMFSSLWCLIAPPGFLPIFGFLSLIISCLTFSMQIWRSIDANNANHLFCSGREPPLFHPALWEAEKKQDSSLAFFASLVNHLDHQNHLNHDQSSSYSFSSCSCSRFLRHLDAGVAQPRMIHNEVEDNFMDDKGWIELGSWCKQSRHFLWKKRFVKKHRLAECWPLANDSWVLFHVSDLQHEGWHAWKIRLRSVVHNWNEIWQGCEILWSEVERWKGSEFAYSGQVPALLAKQYCHW